MAPADQRDVNRLKNLVQAFSDTVGQEIFADMIFSRIDENSNSQAWYFRGLGPTK